MTLEPSVRSRMLWMMMVASGAILASSGMATEDEDPGTEESEAAGVDDGQPMVAVLSLESINLYLDEARYSLTGYPLSTMRAVIETERAEHTIAATESGPAPLSFHELFRGYGAPRIEGVDLGRLTIGAVVPFLSREPSCTLKLNMNMNQSMIGMFKPTPPLPGGGLALPAEVPAAGPGGAMPPLVGIGGGRPANGPRASQLGFICDGAWAILQGSRYEAVFERTGRDVRDASTGRPITLRRTSPDQWEILDDLNNVILEISARTDGGLFIRDELGDSYILYTDTLPDDVDSLGELLAEFPTP